MNAKERKSVFGLLLTAALAAGNAGCGGGSASTPQLSVGVTLSQATATVQPGATAQFTATVSNDSAGKGVTWNVTCSAAACGSVSPTATPSGMPTTYTAPSTQASLTVTLTAASVADGTKTAPVTITVPAGITVSVAPGSATVQPGATAQFKATVNNDPANAGVTWSVSCTPALPSEPGMPCGSVSPTATPSGTAITYTAPTAGDLVVTITAFSVTNGNASGSATIRVPGIAVSIAPQSNTTLNLGAAAQFTATVTNDATNQGVTWTLLYTQNGGLVPCPSATVCGSVSPTTSPSGAAVTYTAPTTPFAGELEVALTATSVANNAASAQAFVFVHGINVSVAPSNASLQAGATQQFTATVSNDSTNSGVTWTLTQSGTACSPGCGTIAPSATASGSATTYTAPPTPPASNVAVTVTATSVALSAASGSATVTVLAITVSVSPISALLPGGTTQQFTATVNNDPTKSGVTWTLAQNGVACAPAACGTLSSGTTNPVTYSAPATVSTSATVALTAYSVTDTTKTATASLHLTTGTVEIVPDSLNFGRVRVNNGTAAPQVAMLTNAGSTALNITSITLTGANTGDFSQTNTCGTSVGAGASCTITVNFVPKAIGGRSASVSISDSSLDSPQQVSLSGTGVTRNAVNAPAVHSALVDSGAAAVPRPTGPSPVGTRVMSLLDSGRSDPYLANGTKRALAVRFWYPASLNQDCPAAEYTSPAVWRYFSELVEVRPFQVATNSCLNAPIMDGAHPVVVFTPGYTATFTDYTFLFEDLASRGYVIASVAHTYETTAVELPDGTLAKSIFGSHLGNTWRGDEQTVSFATYVRLQDLQFVLNELERLNAQHSGPFAGHLDVSRIAMAGHSLGGLTAYLAVQLDARFKAGIVLDSPVPEAAVSATKTPVLLLAAGRKQWDASECRLWSDLNGPRLAVNLQGSEHVALSDWIWLAKDAIETGPMGPEKTMTAVREYIAAFLDTYLRGEPMNPMLTGPSADYPDAAVIAQEQSMCRQP